MLLIIEIRKFFVCFQANWQCPFKNQSLMVVPCKRRRNVALQTGSSGFISLRKCKVPTINRWFLLSSRLNTCTNADCQFWSRVYHATSTTISCRHAALPNHCADTEMSVSKSGQLTFSHKQAVLGHRVIQTWRRLRGSWGVLCRTQHPVLQSHRGCVPCLAKPSVRGSNCITI